MGYFYGNRFMIRYMRDAEPQTAMVRTHKDVSATSEVGFDLTHV